MKPSQQYFLAAFICLLILITGLFFAWNKTVVETVRAPEIANIPTTNLTQPTSSISGNINNETASKAGDLIIISPVNGTTVQNNQIEISGEATPGADVFTTNVDTTADENGRFTMSIGLDSGQNTITVKATDGQGNSEEQTISVEYLSQ
jgi:hypothetical protein